MDPNEALKILRELAGVVLEVDRDGGGDEAHADCIDLAETLQGLDNWLSKGGAKPDAWEGAS